LWRVRRGEVCVVHNQLNEDAVVHVVTI
jgi:hypothetical protein